MSFTTTPRPRTCPESVSGTMQDATESRERVRGGSETFRPANRHLRNLIARAFHALIWWALYMTSRHSRRNTK